MAHSVDKYLWRRFYDKHKRLLTFSGYFIACMIIFPAMTDIGWIEHFLGKEVMVTIDFCLSAWIAYEMANEQEL